MWRPKGPHAVSFGKEYKRAMISKSGGRQGSEMLWEELGGGVHLGCFETRRFHVVLLLGARPEEVRTWQALERSPSLARVWTVEDLWLEVGWGPEE